jgi:glyoxylase-like metal-dependent hydrolase (beta-lactamase superfamily II)
MVTRRRVICAALATPALTRPVFAATTIKAGARTVDTLSDGNLVLPGDFILGGMPKDEVAAILARHGLAADQLTPPCNVTLVRDGTNTILFDVGSGPDFQPSAGKLLAAIEALGLSPEEVTHVVFTHGHPDHLWGLLDEFDEPVFPSAEHAIGRAEFAYWIDPATVGTIGAARTTFAVGAARRLNLIAESIRLLEDGESVVDGVVARLTPGHTPGHLAFEIGTGSDALLVVGDAIGNHHVAFERPAWASGSDQDPEAAAKTRTALLDDLAGRGIALVGFHLPDGGIGRAERSGDGFRFVSDT